MSLYGLYDITEKKLFYLVEGKLKWKKKIH